MLYSFDIFDTLLFRKVPNSTDIFKIMSTNTNIKKTVGSVSFYKVRQYAEFFLRRVQIHEVTINDIYILIGKILHLSEKQIAELKKIELETEKKETVLNKLILSKIKHLLKNGEKVILISDMYWNEVKIRELLCEKDSIFKNIPIYISCDYNASKSNGNLYKIVKKKEGVQYNNWKHIGDNIRSDIRIPKKFGILTKHYKCVRFYEYEKKIIMSECSYSEILNIIFDAKNENNCEAFNLGVSIAAPMVYQYVNWVLETAQKENIKILYFVLRDGYILKRVADVIINYRKLDIKTDFLYGSRVAWRFPDLKIENLKNLSVWDASNYIFREPSYAFVPFARLGFSKKELTEIFGEEFCVLKIYTFSDFKKIIERALENDEFKEKLEKNIIRSGEYLYLYLQQTLDRSAKYAFVDTNSTGKTQECLRNFLKKKGVNADELKFFYHTWLSEKKTNSKTQFVFASDRKMDSRFPEALFRAPLNPCIGYKIENDTVLPKFFDSDFCAWNYSFDYESYLKGILFFSKKFEENRNDNCVLLDNYVDILTKVVNFDIISKDVIRQIAKLPFNPDLAGNEILDFYPEIKWSALLHPFSQLIYYPKGSFYLKGGLWIWFYNILYSMVKIKRKSKKMYKK